MNRITAKLADVATISFAGSRMTPGFGSIEQHAAEIEREDFRSIDFLPVSNSVSSFRKGGG